MKIEVVSWISKFNLTLNISGFEMIPLGGIRLKNLNKLKLVRSDTFVLMSEVKKAGYN